MDNIDFSDNVKETAWTILGWKPTSETSYEKFLTTSLDLHTKNEGVINLHKLLGKQYLQNIENFLKERGIHG